MIDKRTDNAISNLEVYMATHRKVEHKIPSYVCKVQVNCNKDTCWDDYLHDNEGDNISDLNWLISEFTALYYAWKNRKGNARYKGLYHYRRYFSYLDIPLMQEYVYTNHNKVYEECITEEKILVLLEQYDILIGVPAHPRINNLNEHLRRYCRDEVLAFLEKVIGQYYPEYIGSYKEYMSQPWMSLHSMFIAKEDIFNKLCENVFGVLLPLITELTEVENIKLNGRELSYVGELLVPFFVYAHKWNCKYQHILLDVDFFEDMDKQFLRQRVFRTIDKIPGICLFVRKMIHNLSLEQKEIYEGRARLIKESNARLGENSE